MLSLSPKYHPHVYIYSYTNCICIYAHIFTSVNVFVGNNNKRIIKITNRPTTTIAGTIEKAKSKCPQTKKKKIPTASCRFSQRIALRFRWMQWFTIGYQMRPSLSRTWRMLTIRPGYWHRLLYETQWELGICMRYSASV